MARLPLEHVRILDFGTAWAGSTPGMLVGDMGAQVIKIEAWNRIDPVRYTGPALRRERAQKQEDLVNMRVYVHAVNRNKLGVTLDLTTPEGKETLVDLIKISDAVIDNFSAGVTQRLGIDYPSLRKIRPDIIAMSMTMVGQEGPWRDARGYAGNMSGMGGLVSLTGYSDEPEPGGYLTGSGDWNTGESAAMALLLALAHRQRTGQGQFIDLSGAESTAWLLGEPIMDYIMNQRVAGHQGNYHSTLVPHGTYPCKGEDKWVSIAVDTEEEWQNLCQATGNSHWAGDERFKDKYSRMRHRKELDRLIGEWTQGHAHYQVMELLQKAGVAAAPVLNALGRYEDPHLSQRGTFVALVHDKSGPELMYNTAWRLLDTPGAVRSPGPNVGQHNQEVLGEILGIPKERMSQFLGTGEIGIPRDLR